MPYWRLHYHLVWATYQRHSLLSAEREPVIHNTLATKCRELHVLLHAVGNTEDHVHVLVSVPPKLAIAECVRHLKGASSHAANRVPDVESIFRWQDSYGALTVSEDGLPWVMEYVRDQKQHHSTQTLLVMLERTGLPRK